MADIPNDGRTRVTWTDAVPAVLDAPTVAELEAGIDLECLITPDGLVGWEPDTGEIDNTKLCSTFNTKTVGRISFSGTMLRFYKQDGTDDPYDTMTYLTSGAITIRRYVPSEDDWTAADAVSVYPVTCGETRELPPENTQEGSIAKYEVPTTITAEPALRAVVAA